jgi:tail tube protein gp19
MKHLADQYNRNYAFRVEISGGDGPDSNEGAWNSVRGGGLRIHETQGVTAGQDQFKNHSPGISEWQDLVLVGAVTDKRKAMLDWYKNMQEKGGPDDVYKDITITMTNREGSDTWSVNYLHCFLTAYSLCPLDGDEEDVEACETVELCVGYSDNFLT